MEPRLLRLHQLPGHMPGRAGQDERRRDGAWCVPLTSLLHFYTPLLLHSTLCCVDKTYGPILQPIFISVDPARDTLPQMARYVRDFHPRLIGLAGDYATTKATCKAYRVYFSTPPGTKPGDDYLVDHSIFFYFMDPDGKFVDAFGKSSTETDVIERVKREIEEWKAEQGRLV